MSDKDKRDPSQALEAELLPIGVKDGRGRPKIEPTEDDCATVLRIMCEGGSKAEVCAEIGISFPTFYRWLEDHEFFSEAVTHGETLSQAWFERVGRKGMFVPGFQGNIWQLHMRNRFGWAGQDKPGLSAKKDGEKVIISWED
jgi:hypothetical protein